MVRLCGIPLIVSFLISSVCLAQTTPPDSATPSKPHTLSSRKSLHDLLQDPAINSAFMGLNRAMLKTGPDLRLSDQLDTDPILNDPSVVKVLTGIVEQGIKDAKNSGLKTMRPVTMKTNPRVMKAFIESAQKKGLTDQQIANAKVFIASGPMNAYTMSPFLDETVVVLFNTLVKITDDVQLRTTIQHELSHIIDKHVLRGIQVTAMVLQLALIFSKDGIPTDLEALKDYDKYRASLPAEKAYIRDFWDFVFNNLVTLDAGLVTDEATREIMRLNRQTFVEGIIAINKAFRNLDGGHDPTMKDGLQAVLAAGADNPELAKKSVVNFLAASIESLSMMPVPQDDITYLQRMLQDLVKGGEIDDRGGAQFTEKMKELIANLSKSWEASSDRGVLENRKRGATLFSTFMGTEEDRKAAGLVDEFGNITITAKQHRENILQELVDQWIELVATNTPDQLNIELGRDPAQNHPYPLRRVISMLLSEKTISTIGFQNDFLTHVLIYNQFLKQEAAAAAKVAGLSKLKDSDPAEVAFFQKMKTDAQTKKIVLQKAIEKLIDDPGLPQVDALNVRLINLLDFQLALKQDAQESFEAALKESPSAEEKGLMEHFLKIESLAYTSDLMTAVKQRVEAQKANKSSNQEMIAHRLGALEALASPSISNKKIKEIREQLQRDGKSFGRYTRIAMEPGSIVLNQSGEAAARPDTKGTKENPAQLVVNLEPVTKLSHFMSPSCVAGVKSLSK